MTTSRPVQIVPSTLSADFSRLGEDCAALEDAGADRIQWDVMDGAFVPNLTFGPDVIAASRPHTSLPFEAHLMVQSPEALAARYVDAGCGLLIVHAEACAHLHRTLQQIRDLGAAAGVALNPATPAAAVSHVLDLTDMVLVMTVNPGFGGQKYIASMEPKIAEVRRMIDRSGRMTSTWRWTAASAPQRWPERPPPGRTCSWRAAPSSATPRASSPPWPNCAAWPRPPAAGSATSTATHGARQRSEAAPPPG